MDPINAAKDSGMKEMRKLTTSNAEARRLLKQLHDSNAVFIAMPVKASAD